jgi:hypothetical protein
MNRPSTILGTSNINQTSATVNLFNSLGGSNRKFSSDSSSSVGGNPSGVLEYTSDSSMT